MIEEPPREEVSETGPHAHAAGEILPSDSESLKKSSEELDREARQQKVLAMAKGLESSMAEMLGVESSDLPVLQQLIRDEAQKPHREPRDLLQALRRAAYDLSQTSTVSETGTLALSKLVRATLVHIRERESAIFLGKPLGELLELLKEKHGRREIVPGPLLNAALQKVKQYLEDCVRTKFGALTGPEAALLRDLLPNREIHDAVLEHLGSRAMELTALISSKERELKPTPGESIGIINQAQEELSNRKELLKQLFREFFEEEEGEETKTISENKEFGNFEDIETLYGEMNRRLEVDTRPGYDFHFFARFLLEFLVRRDELASRVSPEEMGSMVRTANRVAAFVNQKRFLDLGEALDRGEPAPRLLRSLKMKMFLDVYPEVRAGFQISQEQYMEMSRAFFLQLGRMYRAVGTRPDGFENAARRVMDAKDPELDEAIAFETALRELAGFKPSLHALRDAYGIGEKQKGEDIEVLSRLLQVARGKRGMFFGGRGAKERGKEERGGKGRKRRRWAAQSVDAKLRQAREKLESLAREKKRMELMEGEESQEMPAEHKEILQKLFGKRAKIGIDEITQEIGRVGSRINRLKRVRTTEGHVRERLYRVKRYAEVAEDLTGAVRMMDPGQPIRSTMRELDSMLFSA